MPKVKHRKFDAEEHRYLAAITGTYEKIVVDCQEKFGGLMGVNIFMLSLGMSLAKIMIQSGGDKAQFLEYATECWDTALRDETMGPDGKERVKNA